MFTIAEQLGHGVVQRDSRIPIPEEIRNNQNVQWKKKKKDMRMTANVVMIMKFGLKTGGDLQYQIEVRSSWPTGGIE